MMKKTVGFVILLAGLVSAWAQPVVATNVVRLTPATRLSWDALSAPDLAGYAVQMAQATNVWRSFTTNTVVTLSALSTNLVSGAYVFTVAGVNRDGLEGPAGTLSTNLSRLPAVVVNLRLEVTLQ